MYLWQQSPSPYLMNLISGWTPPQGSVSTNCLLESTVKSQERLFFSTHFIDVYICSLFYPLWDHNTAQYHLFIMSIKSGISILNFSASHFTINDLILYLFRDLLKNWAVAIKIEFHVAPPYLVMRFITYVTNYISPYFYSTYFVKK